MFCQEMCITSSVLYIDFKEKLHPLCILQYTYPEDPDIKGLPHRNSSKASTFNRSKKSVLSKIKGQDQQKCITKVSWSVVAF